MVQTIVPKDFTQYCSSPPLCTMISYGYTLSLGRIFCLLIVHRRSTFGVNILEVSYILYIKQHLYKLQLQQIKLHIEIVNVKPVTPTTILLPVPTFDPRCGAYRTHGLCSASYTEQTQSPRGPYIVLVGHIGQSLLCLLFQFALLCSKHDLHFTA